ncbi:uncharacterized protein FIBRA_04361 [Fibroporia radiculosa]|uniref:Uncharacterized protein n=1 Tax=Fibroporia radiculosa TaxID=599839 RepID=J4IA46_9APHY|nr:uncharacterized protein FIBRA_04361 [Fibroporia radiculosa]CCM02276.1 predicted protein [Fibroporia radiculosa]
MFHRNRLIFAQPKKRRAMMTDLAIGLGIPVLQIIFQYIVSGHRFDIYEQVGCYPFTYNTAPAYPLSVLWPIFIGLVSAVYCILTLRAFFRRRAQFMQCLASSSGLTANRYFRLMALATVELLCTVPISTYGLYLNLSAGPLNPWINWANVHYDYSQVDQYPAIIWRSQRTAIIAFGLSTWAVPFCALIFFAFFGFAEEARKNYFTFWLTVTKPLRMGGRLNSLKLSKLLNERRATSSSATSLPVFVDTKPALPSPTISVDTDIDSYDVKEKSFA